MTGRINDLGVLSGEVLIFGGPYSNIQALEALLEVARARNIEPSQMICTGDLVAYCADPVAVVARVQALGISVVAGNCELQLAAGAPDCGCGFEDGSVCSLLSVDWYEYARSKLSAAQCDWMGEVPHRLLFEHAERRYGVIHGGVGEVARFLWSCDEDTVFTEELAALEREIGPVDGVFAGHSGIAFSRHIGSQIWCNAGVIGMPPNDGRIETEYAILSETGITLHRLSYDAGGAQRAMVTAGLTQGYHTALLIGQWPSEDVLPAQLRR